MNAALGWGADKPRLMLFASAVSWLLSGVFMTYFFVERAMGLDAVTPLLGTAVMLSASAYTTAVLARKLT